MEPWGRLLLGVSVVALTVVLLVDFVRRTADVGPGRSRASALALLSVAAVLGLASLVNA